MVQEEILVCSSDLRSVEDEELKQTLREISCRCCVRSYKENHPERLLELLVLRMAGDCDRYQM